MKYREVTNLRYNYERTYYGDPCPNGCGKDIPVLGGEAVSMVLSFGWCNHGEDCGLLHLYWHCPICEKWFDKEYEEGDGYEY